MCTGIQVHKNGQEGGKQKGRWRRRRRSKKNAENKEAKKQLPSKAEQVASLLATTEAHVAPFDSCKAVSTRRMQIKKLCHGRVNTICADIDKVKVISQELVEALKAEKKTDEELKEKLNKKDPEVKDEMTRGCDYFINLLAREVRVRVEAEGFNGARGDGFPLAAFVTIVSSEVPEFIPVMEAYIYDVCPLALPTPLGKESSKEDFSKKIGMKKNKDGEYESFERFLQRTEGLISFMANVMSSHPAEHALFDGNKGAVKWLESFVGQISKEPGQLPLYVAPVLYAFLTSAGNTLANLHSEEFAKFLKVITDDAVLRLDEGAIGAPSAHRLKETIEDGIEGFEKNLPSKSLGPLYNNGKDNPPPPPSKRQLYEKRKKEEAANFGYDSFSYGYGSQQYGSQQYGSQQYGSAKYGAPQYGSSQYTSSQYGYNSFNYGYDQPQCGSDSSFYCSDSSLNYGSDSSNNGSSDDSATFAPVSRNKTIIAASPPAVSRSRKIIVRSTWNKPVKTVS